MLARTRASTLYACHLNLVAADTAAPLATTIAQHQRVARNNNKKRSSRGTIQIPCSCLQRLRLCTDFKSKKPSLPATTRGRQQQLLSAARDWAITQNCTIPTKFGQARPSCPLVVLAPRSRQLSCAGAWGISFSRAWHMLIITFHFCCISSERAASASASVCACA